MNNPALNPFLDAAAAPTELRASEAYHRALMEGLGRLAGGIAHDFNNLLTVINGYSDLLLAQMTPENPARAGVAQIHKAGQRAEALTRHLTAFSRQQPIKPEMLDLNAAIAESCETLRDELGAAIHLVRIADPELGRIAADPELIHHLVVNLVMNARDAMPGGGELRIEAYNVEVDEAYTQRHLQARSGRYVRLSIRDTGTGMDSDTRAHAFEPFFTTKPRGQGAGLGLATVYGIVLQSGGWIELDTEAGHGTTFKIYFPRVEAKER